MKRLTLLPVLFILLSISCKNDNPSNINNEDGIVSDSAALEPVDSSNLEEIDSEEMVENKDVTSLNEAQVAVQNLLAFCTKKNYSDAAKILAYLGSDNNRMYQDHFNYANASEKSTVDITCDVIAAWLKESESYEFITFEEGNINGKNVSTVEVMFKKQELGVNRKFFDLIKTNKGYLLISLR